MTVQEALISLSRYPIPVRTLLEVAAGRGVSLEEDLTADMANGKNYRLAKADIYFWLSLAPNISQGGQSYSFSEDQRKQFKSMAQAIYAELEPENASTKPVYGYKGSRL